MSPSRRSPAGTFREPISELTTGRLSVYLRCLTFLEEMNVDTISSHELARRFHLNSAQIRKDLACFGELGIRGVGYNVSQLRKHLVEVLGLDQLHRMVIVGAGNLGLALAEYRGFNSDGFEIVALFDSDPEKHGHDTRTGIRIHSPAELKSVVEREQVEIGVIAVPAAAAQPVYESMVDAGIGAVLNFAPTQIRKRSGVKVKSVDLRINLESLSFYLKNRDDVPWREDDDGNDDI